MEITAKRPTSRAGTGIVERRFELRRQDDTVLQVGFSDMMIAYRPEANAAAPGSPDGPLRRRLQGGAAAFSGAGF